MSADENLNEKQFGGSVGRRDIDEHVGQRVHMWESLRPESTRHWFGTISRMTGDGRVVLADPSSRMGHDGEVKPYTVTPQRNIAWGPSWNFEPAEDAK